MRKKVELHRWQPCSMFGASGSLPPPAVWLEGFALKSKRAPSTNDPKRAGFHGNNFQPADTKWEFVTSCGALASLLDDVGTGSSIPVPTSHISHLFFFFPLLLFGFFPQKMLFIFWRKSKKQTRGRKKKQLSFPFHCFLAVISTVPLQQTSTTLTFAAKTVNKWSLESPGIFCVFFPLKRLKAYWRLFTVLSGQLLAGW